MILCLGLTFCAPFLAPIHAIEGNTNDYFNTLLLNVPAFVKNRGLNEIELSLGADTLYFGDLGTVQRTGDISCGYDMERNAVKLSGSLGLEDAHIRFASSGRELRFPKNSAFLKVDLSAMDLLFGEHLDHCARGFSCGKPDGILQGP
ncbi:MAG: hypothetical protein LBH53_03500 [Puniceicoccales bacterium]|jgi:hypothetical protein|nr:hypothetical protein [Puniceicoccales bacterium]